MFVKACIRIGKRTFTPLFQELLPGLTAEQYGKLKNDLRERQAILVPPIVDEQDNILDGGHRLQACSELWDEGIKIPLTVDVREGLSEADKEALSLSANLCRRHLTVAEWKDAARRLRVLGMSTRQIAKVAGVSEKSVRNVCSGAEVSAPEHVTGHDGKTYPAQMPAPEQLTERRAQVAEMAEAGESRRSIARKIGVSVGTVVKDIQNGVGASTVRLTSQPQSLKDVVELVVSVLIEAQENQDWATVSTATQILKKALEK